MCSLISLVLFEIRRAIFHYGNIWHLMGGINRKRVKFTLIGYSFVTLTRLYNIFTNSSRWGIDFQNDITFSIFCWWNYYSLSVFIVWRIRPRIILIFKICQNRSASLQFTLPASNIRHQKDDDSSFYSIAHNYNVRDVCINYPACGVALSFLGTR